MNDNNIVLGWEPAISDAINRFAHKLTKDRKEDLRQEIYLAFLQVEGTIGTQEQAFKIAVGVLDRERKSHMREKKREQGLTERESTEFDKKDADLSGCWDLEQRAQLQEVLRQLPDHLQDILNDLFFVGLTEKDVAEKYHKSQPWVSRKKNLALAFLREPRKL